MQKNAKSHLWKLTRKNAFIATAIVYFDVKLLVLFPRNISLAEWRKKLQSTFYWKEGRKKKICLAVCNIIFIHS